MSHLGADHIGPEAVMRISAFPLRKRGASRVLSRGVTGSDLGSRRSPVAKRGGQKSDQGTGCCKNLMGDGSGRSQRWVAKKVVRSSQILDLFRR